MALSQQEQAAIDALNGKKSAGGSSATPTPKPQAGPGPMSVGSLRKLAGPTNPLLPLYPVFTGAARATGTAVGKVFDVLNRPSAAAQARILRGDKAGAQTFVHSLPPEQYTADTAEIARRDMANDRMLKPLPFLPYSFGPHVGKPMTKEEYDKQPGWWHQAVELTTALRHDPTTYLGGAGILDHLGEAIFSKSFPAFSKAVQAMSISTNPKIRQLGAGLGHAYDVTHFKGAVQRNLAAKYGTEGLHYFRGLKSINNVRRTKAADLTNTLLDEYDKVTKGLKPEEEADLYRAIHTGTVAELPPNLSMRAEKFKQVTDQLAHLQGTEELQTALREGVERPATSVRGRPLAPGESATERVGGGFESPAFMKRFESEQPRGMQGLFSYRQHYVPTAHDPHQLIAEEANKGSLLGLDAKTLGEANFIREAPHIAGETRLEDLLRSPGEAAKTASTVEKEDKNLLERGEGVQLLGPRIQRKVITARLKSGAQALAAHDAEGKVAELFGEKTWDTVPSDAKAFFQETWNEPGGKEFWTGLAKGAIDIPKIGLFALPFRHIANIATLTALADPGALPGTLGKYAQLMVFGTGSRRLSALAGKVSPKAGEYLSHEAAAARRANMLGKAGEYGVAGVPSVDRRAASGWLGRIPGIGDIYKASNHALWSFDDAAKATRFNRLVRKYRTEGADEAHAAYRAADQVGAEMIDYSNTSPLTETLRYIAPFATYRSKVPVAVATGTLRHPEIPLTMGRASPELIGDVQQAPPDAQGKPQVGKSFLPIAETFRGVENPAEFARSTVGYPFAMGASLAGKAVTKAAGISQPDIAYFATYGKDPDLKYLANQIIGSFPGGEAGLGALGLGEFTNQGSLSGAVRGQTGFGISRGPSPTQTALPGLLDAAQKQADAANKRGDTATAKAISTAIERIKERYRLYVP